VGCEFAFCICSIWPDSASVDNGLIREREPTQYLAVLNRWLAAGSGADEQMFGED